jgi:hypothetical protein
MLAAPLRATQRICAAVADPPAVTGLAQHKRTRYKITVTRVTVVPNGRDSRRMRSQHPVLLSRLITGVTVLLLVLGFGVGGLAAWSGTINLCRVADLFFDLSLVVTMVARGGSLLRP